jgi:hypothetical protein
MAALNDTALLWQEEIYQLETNDPVIGGTPNETTGAGMDNIPHLQLARRTRFLKETMDAAGLRATDSPLVTLNAAFRNGTYRFAAADPNKPATGVAGTVVVAAAASDAVNQVAMQSGGTRMWTRFWNGVVWSAWSEIWQMPGVNSLLGISGYQIFPSGLIWQWGGASGSVANATASAGNVSVTFPLAFPNAVYRVFASQEGEAAEVGEMGIGVLSQSLTGATIRFIRHSGTNISGSETVRASVFAVGR